MQQSSSNLKYRRIICDSITPLDECGQQSERMLTLAGNERIMRSLTFFVFVSAQIDLVSPFWLVSKSN